MGLGEGCFTTEDTEGFGRGEGPQISPISQMGRVTDTADGTESGGQAG